MVQLGDQDGQEAGVVGGDRGGDLGERERGRVAERHLALALADQAPSQLQLRVRGGRRRQAAQELRQRA